jgi:hypothetical protein
VLDWGFGVLVMSGIEESDVGKVSLGTVSKRVICGEKGYYFPTCSNCCCRK